MGSPCVLTLYVQSVSQYKEAVFRCEKEMERLEHKYSRYLPNSLLSQINASAGSGKGMALDDETWQLLNYANIAFEQSDGLFDITSGILRTAWNFKQPQLPDADKLKLLIEKIGWQKIHLDQQHFVLPEPRMQLDLGGIVKEYAADCLANILKHQHIQSGVIDLAGDIRILGPHPNGSPWQVGISHPQHPEQAIATIALSSGALASSGDYARCFELNGKRYSHLLNPKTGWPIQGLAGVSVWAEQCVVAGSIATIAMLKGENEGNQWLKEVGVPFVSINQEMEIVRNEVL